MADQAWIDLVLARAGELRAAGVLSIGPGSATFAPADPPPPDTSKIVNDVNEVSLDPFEDVAAYPGGFVPRFDIQPLEHEQE